MAREMNRMVSNTGAECSLTPIINVRDQNQSYSI